MWTLFDLSAFQHREEDVARKRRALYEQVVWDVSRQIEDHVYPSFFSATDGAAAVDPAPDLQFLHGIEIVEIEVPRVLERISFRPTIAGLIGFADMAGPIMEPLVGTVDDMMRWMAPENDFTRETRQHRRTTLQEALDTIIPPRPVKPSVTLPPKIEETPVLPWIDLRCARHYSEAVAPRLPPPSWEQRRDANDRRGK